MWQVPLFFAITEAVMWLASGAASYVSGMKLNIDGGGLG